MTKKIILILGILIIIGLAAFLVLFSKPQTDSQGNSVGFSMREYLPFGSSGSTEDESEGSIAEEGGDDVPSIPSAENMEIPKLRKISSEPVAGAVIMGSSTTTIVRFVEKGTGNVYEARSDSASITRLTNTTLPKIIRAYWLPNGSGFLAQTIMADSEIVETSLVKLVKSAGTENLTPYTTTISKLPTDIKELTIKPDSSKIFYYTASGQSTWYISNPDGTGSSVVFSHALTEWIPRWIAGNLISMQTKGSSLATGYSYAFDAQSKTLSKIGVGMTGISSMPNKEGTSMLQSSGGRSPKLYLASRGSSAVTDLDTVTLAEKCVWTKNKEPVVYCAAPNKIPSLEFPDSWYKGLSFTEDSIEKIEGKNNSHYLVSDLSSESKQKIDATDLLLSPDESHMIFKNKIDGFLWMLRLEDQKVRVTP